MRVLFVTQFAAHFHYFKSIIRALCERGIDVRLLIVKHPKYNKREYLEAIEDFEKQFPKFKSGKIKLRRNSILSKILFASRDILNYRQYYFFDNQSSYYQDRLLKHIPRWLIFFTRLQVLKFLFKSQIVESALRSIESIFQPVPEIVSDIKEYAPDFILASPVNMRRKHFAADLEYLKAAKKLSISSAIPVISWDNLTTKGVFHVTPDYFFAWNESQKQDLMTIHKILPRKIKILGSPLFDGWFRKNLASKSEVDFRREYGLGGNSPILLYLGSSSNMSKDESWIALKMREELDRAELSNVHLAIRPHPSNYEIYQKILRPGISLIPKEGILPNGPEEFQLFYDSLHYSVAVIDGVNTSGIIDATIMDKPGLLVFTKEHEKTQLETQHFRQLIKEDVLYTTDKFKEFPRLVKDILEGRDVKKENRKNFVNKFIRTPGGKKLAGEAIADEVEKIIGVSSEASL